MRLTGGTGVAGVASASTSSTAAPKPPGSTLSSSVTTSCVPWALRMISSRSSGRAKRASTTPTDQPSFASSVRHGHPTRDDGAQSDDDDVVTLAQDLASADLERQRIDRRQVEAGVARILQGEGVLLAEGRVQQTTQVLLVARGSQHEIGQLPQGRQHEDALVAGAVLAHQTGTIDADDDGSVVLADVVHDLVEGALQERGVQRHERPLAGESHAGRQGHRVLLGDADVVGAMREALAEGGHAGAGGHARRDGHDARVLLGDADRARRP